MKKNLYVSDYEPIDEINRENYYVDMDSFGQDCPDNWEEIAQALNNEIDKLPYDGDKLSFADLVADLWERYCSNDPSLAELPRPEWGASSWN